jgi:lysophospholipase L1-like esterase
MKTKIIIIISLGLLMLVGFTFNEKSKYETINLMREKKSVTIVCFGDSLTAGAKAGGKGEVTTQYPYPTVLKNELSEKYKYKEITIINNGHPGYRADQSLTLFNDEVVSLKPNLVIIMMGSNEILQNSPTDILKSSLDKMIKKSLENNIECMIMTIPPMAKDNKEKIDLVNNIIKNLAIDNSIKLIDVNKGIEDIVIDKKENLNTMLPDGVHFSDDKYKYIANIVFEQIK